MDYVYQKLDTSMAQIRLLLLEPAQNKREEIRCSLETVDLGKPERRQYEALSYAWGTDPEPGIIYMNDHDFPVKINLYLALLHLRKADATRYLWVDAVSINQSDILERNHQVRQMRDIYHNAAGVVVWLGESDDDIDKAMVAVHNRQIRLSDPQMDLSICVGIAKLFKKPWWDRIWVLQEVAVANKDPLAVCGQMTVPFSNLWSLRSKPEIFEAFSLKPGTLGITLHDLPSLKGRISDEYLDFLTSATYFEANQFTQLGREDRGDVRIEDFNRLLDNTSARLATDPRDKIFALLGLAATDVSENFTIDYGQSMSRPYQQATMLLLKSRNSAVDLYYASAMRNAELPSWCIDFSTRWFPDHRNFITNGDFRGHRVANAGPKKSLIVPDLEQDAISVSGLKIGNVQYANVRDRRTADSSLTIESFTALDEERQIQERQKILIALLDFVRPFAAAAFAATCDRLGHHRACEIFAAGRIWRVVEYGHRDEQKTRDGSKRKLFDDYAAVEKYVWEQDDRWKEVSCPWSHLVPNIPDTIEWPDLELRVMELALKIVDCTFIVTDTAYFGKASGRVEPGDVVCVIYGCNWPAILRPTGSSFKLLSWAWINGVMRGELFGDSECKRPPAQDRAKTDVRQTKEKFSRSIRGILGRHKRHAAEVIMPHEGEASFYLI